MAKKLRRHRMNEWNERLHGRTSQTYQFKKFKFFMRRLRFHSLFARSFLFVSQHITAAAGYTEWCLSDFEASRQAV